MKGTEKIIAHIRTEAEEQSAAILAQAEQQCAAIRADFESRARERYSERLLQGEKACEDRVDSMDRIARMEAKKGVLALKQEMVSRSFFERDPEDFFDFYREKLVYPDAEPNDCHKALAALEEAGKLTAVVTQNIDGLHQKAGSKKVFELHGSVLRNYCTRCRKFFDEKAILQAERVPHCDRCGGIIKPDVVLYEEMLDEDVMDGAARAIRGADMLIIGGTSLVVYPAAGFVRYFRGKHLVLINKTVTPMDNEADLVIHDDIARVMGEAVKAL